MSLEKSIKYKKEYRKPYYDSRRFDWSCRCNGRCSYCKRNRLHATNRKLDAANDQIKEL